MNKKMEYIIRRTGDSTFSVELKGKKDDLELFKTLATTSGYKTEEGENRLWIIEVTDTSKLIELLKAKGQKYGVYFVEIVKRIEPAGETKPTGEAETTQDGKPEIKSEGATTAGTQETKEGWKEGTVITKANQVYVIKRHSSGEIMAYCHAGDFWRFCNIQKRTIGGVVEEEKTPVVKTDNFTIGQEVRAGVYWLNQKELICPNTKLVYGYNFSEGRINIHFSETRNITDADVKVLAVNMPKEFLEKEKNSKTWAEALNMAAKSEPTAAEEKTPAVSEELIYTDEDLGESIIRTKKGEYWIINTKTGEKIGGKVQTQKEAMEILLKKFAEVCRLRKEKLAETTTTKKADTTQDGKQAVNAEEMTPTGTSEVKKETADVITPKLKALADEACEQIAEKNAKKAKETEEAAELGRINEMKKLSDESSKKLTEAYKPKEAVIKFKRGEKINNNFIAVSKTFCINMTTKRLHKFDPFCGHVYEDVGPAGIVDLRVLEKYESENKKIDLPSEAKTTQETSGEPEDMKIYRLLLEAVNKLPKEAIERTSKEVTRKGYDTTGYAYQYMVNCFNDVLGFRWGFDYKIIKEIEGEWKSGGKKYWEITVDLTIWIRTGTTNSSRTCAGGHKSEMHADALKGAITNAFKKTAALYGVGKKAYEGTLDDDLRPIPQRQDKKQEQPKEAIRCAKCGSYITIAELVFCTKPENDAKFHGQGLCATHRKEATEAAKDTAVKEEVKEK